MKNEKKIKILIYIHTFHAYVVPCILLLLAYHYSVGTMYVFLWIFIALLWIAILGKIYAKKINKLKQKIDEEHQK
jgi:hypothetical protein